MLNIVAVGGEIIFLISFLRKDEPAESSSFSWLRVGLLLTMRNWDLFGG